MKKLLSITICIFTCLVLTACTNTNYGRGDQYTDGYNTDEFTEINDNPFVDTIINNVSNVSLVANSAAYSMIRGYINEGLPVDRNMVRIEEMINFFDYQYNQPEEDQLFGFTTQIINTPWNEETNLLFVGLQTDKKELTGVANNIVLLIDVSGSMNGAKKLPLVKESLSLLIEQMGINDIISIVTYASNENVVLDGANYNQKQLIYQTVDNLEAYGATNGQRGLEMAYEIATKNFISDGNNRIILATDGDFNLGMTETDDLVEYISQKRETGIYFSGFGFGYGNYKDRKLEALAKAGNGTYYYIDDMFSAKKAFVDDIAGTLYTLARDTKAQITFNQSNVIKYRLIGYENRQLTDNEYEDDMTDAGEIGSNLQVTAIYEVVLNDKLSGDIAQFQVKYKAPDKTDDFNYKLDFSIGLEAIVDHASEDFLFISAVVEFGLILRNSKYKNNASLNSLLTRIKDLASVKNDEYKSDFVDLVKTYQQQKK